MRYNDTVRMLREAGENWVGEALDGRKRLRVWADDLEDYATVDVPRHFTSRLIAALSLPDDEDFIDALDELRDDIARG